jgi:hypothetical protein
MVVYQIVLSLLIGNSTGDVQQAFAYREAHFTKADSWQEFEKLLNEKGGLFQRIGMELPKRNKD